MNKLLSSPHSFTIFNIMKDQWLPYNEIEELQWKRFKNLLRYAYENTAFYRKLFDDINLTPNDIKKITDIHNIPLTTRENLRNPNHLIASGVEKKRMHFSITSGSTGRRTTTYFDRRGWLIGKYYLKLRARFSCGVRYLDRIAQITESKTYGNFLTELFQRKKIFSVLDPIENQIPKLIKYNPSVMYGFPSFFSALIDKGATGINPSRIFTSSEMLDVKTRKKIEIGFHSEIFDIYGSTEVKEIAWECSEHDGYHINSDWLLVEFQRTGEDVVNEEGSIVVTPLFNYGMPLIRYELGDTGKLITRKCPCKRGLPLMAPGMGRSVDYFILSDNSRISPYAMTCSIEKIEGFAQYQIVQENKDLIQVNIVPEKEFKEESKQQIISALKPFLPGVTIQVVICEHIPKEESGKYRIVLSKVR